MNGLGSGGMTAQDRRRHYLNNRSDVGVAIIDDDHSYLYRPRQVIVRGNLTSMANASSLLSHEFSGTVQPSVLDMLPGNQARPGPGSPPVQPGRLRRLDIDPALGGVRHFLPQGTDPREAIARLAGAGIDASLDHIFCGEQYWAGEPAFVPEPVPASDLPEVDDNRTLGAGVMIGIIDTGIDRCADRHPSLAGRSVVTEDDYDRLDGDLDGHLDHEAGHGTFIAGIVMRHAPGAHFLSYAALDPAGVGHETAIANAITDAAHDGCKIINLSLGGYTRDDEPPAILRDAIKSLDGKDVVVVAAAGNAYDEAPSQRPFWPAAFTRDFPWVVAVAAGKSATELASFSNRGNWVSCRTNGEDVVSTYVRGTWDPEDGGFKRFDGYARWSGTSFAAPRIAAAIAARMTPSDGVSAIDGKNAVLKDGEPGSNDGGGVFIQ